MKVPLPVTDFGKTVSIPEPAIETVSPFGAIAISGQASELRLHNGPEPVRNLNVIEDFAAAVFPVPNVADVEARTRSAKMVSDLELNLFVILIFLIHLLTTE